MLWQRRSLAVAVLLAGLAPVGCVRLTMDYDSVVDQELIQVQQVTEEFLGHLDADAGTPAAAYSNTRDFYIRIDALLRTVRTRVQYQPKSTEVVTQIDALRQSLRDLEQLQKNAGSSGLNVGEVGLARAPLETQFAAIAQLQLALKHKTGSQPSAAMAPALH